MDVQNSACVRCLMTVSESVGLYTDQLETGFRTGETSYTSMYVHLHCHTHCSRVASSFPLH